MHMTSTIETQPEELIRDKPTELARRMVDLLSDRQAEDILLLDISGVASFADYFVIATADNPRLMRALVQMIDKDLRNEGIKPLHREGDSDSGWVLVDYGAIIVHIFSGDLRSYYALEELWQEATEVVRIQ
jgi:ribosome-associated protein